MSGFKPDPNALWRRVMALFLDAGDGEIVPHDDLLALAGNMRSVRSAVTRATRELEEHHQRTIVNIRGEGYRLAQPSEHRELAIGHIDRSRSQVLRARSRVTSTDRTRLASDDARYHDAMAIALGRMAQGLDDLAQRSSAHEAMLDEHDQRIAALEEKIA